MNPVFSIIVPVYNVGRWLLPCLESIRKQVGSWECILIDDGSSDGSETVCDKIATEDSRFRVIHQKNSGVSVARNKGLEEATGDWVWFVDADDVIHPESMKCLTRVINVSSEDFIYFDYLHGENISFSEVVIPEELAIKAKEDYIPEMSLWRCVFRREISENIRFENYIVGEDVLFCTKVSAQASRLGYIPVNLYGYVKRENSVMHTPSFRRSQDSILWMRQILLFYDSFEKNYYKHLEKNRWNKFFFGTAFNIMQHGSDIQEKLIDIWFQEVSQSRILKTPLKIAFLRSIYLFTEHFPFMKKRAVQFNAFVFSSFIKIRKILGR